MGSAVSVGLFVVDRVPSTPSFLPVGRLPNMWAEAVNYALLRTRRAVDSFCIGPTVADGFYSFAFFLSVGFRSASGSKLEFPVILRVHFAHELTDKAEHTIV